MSSREISLRVADARQRDVGHGKVRIVNDTMQKLGITAGDFVEIHGKKMTVALAWPAYAEDEGQEIVRMDGFIRRNAGVALNEYVNVRKADVKEAQEIVFAPSDVRLTVDDELVNFVKRRFMDMPFIEGDMTLLSIFGSAVPLIVTRTRPRGPVKITETVHLQVLSEPTPEKKGIPIVTYEDIGGLREEIHRIREMVELPLRHPELFQRLGIEPPRGVFLYGPPGCGKTLLAKALANESDANFTVISGPEIMSKYYGESETPTAMREVYVEVPQVQWTQVGGLKQAKQELMESVEWPLQQPEVFKRMGINPPRGILLYGPPGSGKTLLARAVATESEANFISIKGPEMFSKWVGESEKAIREVFRKGRTAAPAIIFFDELDAIVPKRGLGYADSGASERVISQLLTEIDGIETLQNVLVIAATNRPDILDPAVMRPGRFDRLIYVPSPDFDSLKEIFKIHAGSMPISKDVSLDELARKAQGYSGADIEAICREAAMNTLREDVDATEVSKRDFDEAIERVGSSIAPENDAWYQKFSKRLRRERTAARIPVT